MGYLKLPAEFKKKWLIALRSGKYIQGQGRLRDYFNCYCCLGVAARVAGDKKKDITNVCYPRDLDTTQLPKPLKSGAVVRRLSNMNDEGQTFATIADWIEKYL